MSNLDTLDTRNGTVVAEWEFPARGRQRSFTWQLVRFECEYGPTFGLASNTPFDGEPDELEHTMFLTGLTERKAFRDAERAGARRNAKRIK